MTLKFGKTCRVMLFISVFVLAYTGGQIVDASAGDCEENDDEADGNQPNFKTVVGADGRKVIVIAKAFIVCGKVPRPNVFYVIQATSINYEWENLKRNFLPKIRESVRKVPF